MRFAVTVWTNGQGIVDSVLSSVGQANSMMNLKIWGTIRCAKKWSIILARFTMAFSASHHFGHNVRVAKKYCYDDFCPFCVLFRGQ